MNNRPTQKADGLRAMREANFMRRNAPKLPPVEIKKVLAERVVDATAKIAASQARKAARKAKRPA